MSGNKYLLDTNAAIAILNDDPEMLGWMPDEAEFYLNPTVLGELYYGAVNSTRFDDNLARVARLRARCPMLGHDEEAALVYGVVKDGMRRKGLPIPHNDLWIAASAIRNGVPLVTRDHHFVGVDDLVTIRW